MPSVRRSELGAFLRRNPFGDGLTEGLFYREKMRAIHRVAPPILIGEGGPPQVLEIGGGRSGLARMLYPDAEVVTVDIDPSLSQGGPPGADTAFVCADARQLPFASGSFDAVTLFDVLEHIGEDQAAAAEALRVARPGAPILTSAPTANWRYPFYRVLKSRCPTEDELMARWGHVRRGYSRPALEGLFSRAPDRTASFINPVTAFYHDVAFSNLPRRARRLLYAAAAPAVWLGYVGHRPDSPGSELAAAWTR
jgi:ubiquinone/menaquinone biosynthesis C-methylase UbiE